MDEVDEMYKMYGTSRSSIHPPIRYCKQMNKLPMVWLVLIIVILLEKMCGISIFEVKWDKMGWNADIYLPIYARGSEAQDKDDIT